MSYAIAVPLRWTLVAVGCAALLGSGASATGVDPSARTRAREMGRARVILELAAERVGAPANPNLAGARRARIHAVQSDVLARLAPGPDRRVRRFPTLPLLALDASIEDLDRLEAAPEVVSVSIDRLRAPTLDFSAPLVEAAAAWSIGLDGSGQTISILDTGVDGAHPFLNGKIVAEACFSAGRDCPNGRMTQFGFGASVPCTYATSGCKHGTHVAGIAAGRGTTLDGIAREASLIAIQVFSRFSGAFFCGSGESPCALSYTSDQIAGLEHVFSLRTSYSIAAANLSLGGGMYTSQDQCDADEAATKSIVDDLRDAGIATTISSGNDGFTNALSSPACISSAISVGWTTKVDTVSLSSNTAPFLSLLATGSGIKSSVPGGGFARFSGTSMAAPHVAGAYAIMRQFDPTSTVSANLSALQSAGKPITDSRNGLIKPRIQILAAMPGAMLRIPAVGVPGRALLVSALCGLAAGFSWLSRRVRGTGATRTRR